MTLSELPVAADVSGEVPAATGPLTIRVVETPAPQGSKKAFVRGRHAVLVESSDKVRPWRQAVVAAACDVLGETLPLEGPVHVSIVFWLPRPKSEPKTRRTWPCRRPDVDKLTRSTFDALTTAGVWGDDAQVVEMQVRKDWATEHERVGATISVDTSPFQAIA